MLDNETANEGNKMNANELSQFEEFNISQCVLDARFAKTLGSIEINPTVEEGQFVRVRVHASGSNREWELTAVLAEEEVGLRCVLGVVTSQVFDAIRK